MTKLRLRSKVNFPANVTADGGIAVRKESGQWVVYPKFSDLVSIAASSVQDPTTQQVWIYNPAEDTYAVLTLGGLGDALFKLTSTTSNSIGLGSKTFTVQPNKDVGVGQYVLITDDAAPASNGMYGKITDYTGSSLTVSVEGVIGSGTKTAWTIRVSGATGATGATGTTGSASGVRQTYSTTTADADPGAGTFRLNNATPSSATAAYLDNLDAGGATVSGIFDTWDDSTNTTKGLLFLQKTTDPTVWASFRVTGSVVDGTGYRKLTLSSGAGSGAFTNGDVFTLTFSPAGDAGTNGAVATPEDHGAVGDGVADDLAAIVAAAAANGGYVTGIPGSIYRLELGTSGYSIPTTFVFNLNGATLKPIYTGTSYPFEKSINSVATYALSAQVNGAVSVTTVDNPPSGLAAGDNVMFYSDGLGGSNPPSWRRVASVSGTTTGLDRIIPFAYSGSITMRKVALYEKFIIENGTLDYSLIDDNALGGFNISGYKQLRFANLDITNVNFDRADGTDYVITTGYCLKADFSDIRIRDATKNGTFINAGNHEYVNVEGVVGQGDGFGINVFNCDFFSIERNAITGRFQEGTTYSVRGIKVIGCREGTVRANRVNNYDSGIKIESTAGVQVESNSLDWCGVSINYSNQAPLSTSYENNAIRNNKIRFSTNTSGAIVVSDDTSNKTIISGNIITDAYGPGIRSDGLDVQITGNNIFNWGRSASTSAAIKIGDVDATGLMDGNLAITDNSSNVAWYVQSGNTGFRVGANFTNATTIWDATHQAGIQSKPNDSRVDVFTSSGTATKPPWATEARVTLMAGGSGGGSGRRGAAGSVRCGGGGGAGGGLNGAVIPASLISTSTTVTIGAGGAGGAAVTTNDTDGNAGTAGGQTSFGALLRAAPGGGGAGGTATSGTGGSAGSLTAHVPGAGAAASTTGLVGVAGNRVAIGGSGGGSGGGITTGNVDSAGGNGATPSGAYNNSTSAATGGTASSGTAGGNGQSVDANMAIGGASGAGGGSNSTGAAGAGGNGGSYGGGGGGGGASLNGNNSGKGGDGAPGICIVIWR